MNTETEPMFLPRLVRIEEKLDSFLFRTATVETRVEGHDVRLRLLEQGNAKIFAAAGAIALGVSVFGSELLNKLF